MQADKYQQLNHKVFRSCIYQSTILAQKVSCKQFFHALLECYIDQQQNQI